MKALTKIRFSVKLKNVNKRFSAKPKGGEY